MTRAYIDTSWNFQTNPDNTPWMPGYRFWLRQPSKTGGRGHTMMEPRRYWVFFEIDRDGLVRWTGGVKPTVPTLNRATEAYARGRPGSNYGPGV